MRKPFIAGNWKMFKTTKEAVEFAENFKKIYVSSDVRTGICAPFTQLSALKEVFKDTDIKIGAQNMHFAEKGAFTGEISAEMLKEIGVDYCIIGHSERRQYFNETDETANKKLITAFRHNIIPILCVGEVLEEREAGKEFDVVKKQLTTALIDLTAEQAADLFIAYEPVWAIGTGRNATPEARSNPCVIAPIAIAAKEAPTIVGTGGCFVNAQTNMIIKGISITMFQSYISFKIFMVLTADSGNSLLSI